MNSTKQHWRRIAQPTVDPTTGQLPRHQDPRHLPKLVGGNTGMVRHRRRLPGLSRHAGLQLNPATDWMYTADPGKAGPGFAVDSPLGASLYCALARACASRWRNSAIPSSPGPAAGRKYALRALFWALKVSFEAAEQRFRGVRGRRRRCANQRLDERKANCGTERGSENGCFVCGTDGSNPSPSSGQSVSLPLRFRRPRTWAFRAAVGGWVGAWVARDAQGASRSHQPAAYLCRAIFQYRSAAEVISENAAPVPTKSGSSRRLTCVDL